MPVCPAGFPILVSSDAPAPLGYAARELSRYFERMDGVTHPVLQDAAGFALRIVHGAKNLPDGAFRMTVTESGILLEAGIPAGCV